MPKNPVFDLARGKASPELIERLFNSPGAYWAGDEFWTLNPTRGDSSIGSFSINGRTGMWSDFAGDGGDLISLLVESGRAESKVKAAELIVLALGGTLPEASSTLPSAPKSEGKKKDKPKPIIPIPEDTVQSLQDRVKGKWAQDNRGTAIKTWAWRRDDGRMWCVTTRYEKDGKKDVIPHYYGDDNRWHEGDPMETGRHLYRLDQIVKADAGTHILLVEGEKCASVKVNGYLLATWIGGGKAWQKTDWAPLERFAAAGLLTIWPDADAQLDKQGKLMLWDDQPGQKTSVGIMRRLPGSNILDVKDKAAVKNGWDIADAEAEGIDIPAFIQDRVILTSEKSAAPGSRPDDQAPFLCLGFDKGGYYFMRKDRRVVFSISMGSFNGSKLGEIAPLSWWGIMNMCTDQGNIKVALAQDMLMNYQDTVGFFDPLKMRGAGVWRDYDGVILNTGDRIVTLDGRSMAYTDFKSTFYYTPSQVKFGEMFGAESQPEEGKQLESLFLAQEFVEQSMAVMTMGWALISPFAGVLTWRPHIWVTGRKGSGKSWVWDNLMKAISGPFAFIANGKTTVAGAMRALDQDVRPAYFGEMEPKSKSSRERIAALLELARNASDDSAADTTMSDSGGGVRTFKTRSPMAFMSTMIPAEDSATESRITRVELRSQDADGQSAKRVKSDRLFAGIMDDPGRFRRRIFRALPRIIADIEWLRSNFVGVFGSQRAADQIAPMIAAAWAVQSDLSVRTAQPWIEKLMIEICSDSKVLADDEDTFMYHLISIAVRTDDNTTRSISELLDRISKGDDQNETALNILERHGITLRRKGIYAKWILSIATQAEPLAKIFSDTKWGDGYASQIKRNPCTLSGQTRSIRLKIGKLRCHDLDWEMFRSKYMGDENEEPKLSDSGEF